MAQVLESLSVIFLSPAKDKLSFLLWCVFGAVLLVLVYLKYRRNTLGRAVRTLLEGEIFEEEKALPAEKITQKKGVLKALDGRDRLVANVEKDGVKHYYIPEDRRKKAEYLFKASGDSFLVTLGSAAALYAVLVALYYLLPIIFPEIFGTF